jgi:hemerythrin-like domain-containing protein
MGDVTAPLREEHEELAPQIERLGVVADSIGEAPRETLRHNLDKVHEFLLRHILPHALAEEQVLYPAVSKILGTPQATTTMSCDHAEINRLARRLDALRAQITGDDFDAEKSNDLRRVLYGLHALLKAHLAKEEEVYFPLLDAHLSEEEAHRLFHEMTQVAEGVGGHGH